MYYQRKSTVIFHFSIRLKCLVGLIIWLNLPPSVKAQDHYVDSLTQIIETGAGKTKATAFSDLCWHYVFSQTDTAIQIAQSGVAYALKNGNDTSLSSLYNRLGVAYDVAGQPYEAEKQYFKAIEIAKRGKVLHNEAGALNNLGLIEWNRGNWQEAIAYYLSSIELFEQLDHFPGIGNTYNNIGLILWEEHRYDESIRYFRNALTIRAKAKDEYGTSATILNMGLVFSDIHEIDSALHYLKLAIDQKKKLSDKFGLAKAYNNLAILYEKDHEAYKDSSLYYYQQALILQEEMNNLSGIASTLNNLATALIKRNRVDEAIELLNRSEQIAKRQNLKKIRFEVYWNKAYAYSKLQNSDAVFFYGNKYRHLKDSVWDEEKSKVVNELQTKYEAEKKEKEIIRLDKENALATLQITRQKGLIFGLISGSLLLLAGFGVFFIERKRKRAHEKAQSELIFRQQLLDATISAEEDERQRVAKELHDGLVQDLVVIKMGLQAFSKKVAQNAVLKTEIDLQTSRVDEAANEARVISHQMMPRALMEDGLLYAIEEMLERNFSVHNIKYKFEHFGIENRRFNQAIEIGVYRIAQELVNNILKHSEANQVYVQLYQTSEQLVLHVEDDGKGFDLKDEKSPEGIGIKNIFSRASAVNGAVNYERQNPNGTSANIRIPLNQIGYSS